MNEHDSRDDKGAATEHPSNENHNMASLLEAQGIEIKFPKQGDIREGVIASISSSQILVSIGVKSEGIISGREFDQIPEEERNELQVGDKIPVYVVNPEDQNGNLVLSYNRAQDEASWELAEKLLSSKDAYHGEITGYNKGGLIVLMGRLRGFVPASQISFTRRVNLSGDTPDERWSKMVGEEIDVCVIEVDRERRRLILSERAASTESRETLKDMVIDNLEIGEVRTGRVTSLAEFGAFVNISGADGLVHLSEITWDRIGNPADVLKVGQEVKVKIISIDKEKKRIGLSIRQLLDDPWASEAQRYQEGQLVEGTVTRLAKFGAFARLDEEFEGLIHISEISDKRIEHPKEVLHEGDVLTLRIIKIDPENHRIGLSLRKVESMAYADLDWQTLLAESLQDSAQEDLPQETLAEEEEKTEVIEVEGEEQQEATVGEAPDEDVIPAESTVASEKSDETELPADTGGAVEAGPVNEIIETVVEEKIPVKPRKKKTETVEKVGKVDEVKVAEEAAATEKPKSSRRMTSKTKTSIETQLPEELPVEAVADSGKRDKKESVSVKSAKSSAAKSKPEEPAAEKTKSSGKTTKTKKGAEEPEQASE